MNTEYVKDYKEKELKQYVVAYLLVAVASVGFQTQVVVGGTNTLVSLFQMVAIDVFVGAICVLVFVFNELWTDSAKAKLVYGQLPSSTVFSDISNSKIDATGFDLDKAKVMYTRLFTASAAKQTAEWNALLQKSRDAGRGNVIEAERLQLMTRDICMSTISLLIMNMIAIGVLSVSNNSFLFSLKILGLPIAYLAIMFFVTRAAARSRANRFVTLVIKNDVQDNNDDLPTTEELDGLRNNIGL